MLKVRDEHAKAAVTDSRATGDGHELNEHRDQFYRDCFIFSRMRSEGFSFNSGVRG